MGEENKLELAQLEQVYKNAPFPVVICGDDEAMTFIYANTPAQLIFSPDMVAAHFKEGAKTMPLSQFFKLRRQSLLHEFVDMVRETGTVFHYRVVGINFEGTELPLALSGNLVAVDEGNCIVIYIIQETNYHIGSAKSSSEVMERIFHVAYESNSVDEAIQKIIGIAGLTMEVSRSYIFETISAEVTANTYEWCNEGVVPTIDQLQSLKKADYNYDALVSGGAFITSDIRQLPENDFKILDMQGIKSVAIFPIYDKNTPLGYVGFDDCLQYRSWRAFEIEMLQNVAGVVASLLIRRNAERKAAQTMRILQTISDNLEYSIYVNTLDTFEIVFINNTLAQMRGGAAEVFQGKTCWQALRAGQTQQCDFCPMRKMIDADGNVLLSEYEWEFQDSVTKRWYIVHDAIIDWLDGQKVHIETATEITGQKEYQKSLEHVASTDMMTGVNNREWGMKIMQSMLRNSTEGEESSLVFVDLDGLKMVNDTYGHTSGDDMIISIVSMIRRGIRKSDMIFRWGGDEFVLLLDCTQEQAERVMQNIQTKLAEFNATKSRAYPLSFSYGIAPFYAMGRDADLEDVIGVADRLMYQNKMAKRGKTVGNISEKREEDSSCLS
ncbi:MAG: diguanylate cyclase [Oscillospiraceae bacterium]|nr:diguanylate cyclase [Oscillospiraceae bacterium]